MKDQETIEQFKQLRARNLSYSKISSQLNVSKPTLRKLRIQYPGAIYHVMSRGDHREPIFRDDADRKLFLETLAEAFAKTDWHIHAWCLMPNHLHLVIETPKANLVDGMKWLLALQCSKRGRPLGRGVKKAKRFCPQLYFKSSYILAADFLQAAFKPNFFPYLISDLLH